MPPTIPPRLLTSPPSLHVLLTTTGTRSSIFQLLESLRNLDDSDYLTIVFDQKEDCRVDCYDWAAPPSERDRDRDSGRVVVSLHRLRSFADLVLSCQVRVIHERDGPSGYWGHAARNKHREAVLGKGTLSPSLPFSLLSLSCSLSFSHNFTSFQPQPLNLSSPSSLPVQSRSYPRHTLFAARSPTHVLSYSPPRFPLSAFRCSRFVTCPAFAVDGVLFARGLCLAYRR